MSTFTLHHGPGRIPAPAVEMLAQRWPSDDELGWFAVRQPGVLRFLETRFPGDDEALAVSLAAAWRIVSSYRLADGLPSPRLERSSLARGLYAVARESAGPVAYDGIAERQPDLCTLVIRVLADPPYPLSRDQEIAAAHTLWAVIYALDEAATGRPIP